MTGARKYDHITPILKELYWLPVVKQLEVRDTLTAFKCIKGLAPPSLCNKSRQEARWIQEILGITISLMYHFLDRQQVSNLSHKGLHSNVFKNAIKGHALHELLSHWLSLGVIMNYVSQVFNNMVMCFKCLSKILIVYITFYCNWYGKTHFNWMYQ